MEIYNLSFKFNMFLMFYTVTPLSCSLESALKDLSECIQVDVFH